MTDSIFARKKWLRRLLVGVGVALLWLGIWWLCARIIAHPIKLPTPPAVGAALVRLLGTPRFWQTILSSLVRIVIAYLIGWIAGGVLAALCHAVSPLRPCFSPLMTVVRATPVVSFILLLWMLIGRDALPVFIASLMVMPVVFTELSSGLDALDRDLLEVTKIYQFSFARRLRYFYFPSLLPHIRAAAANSMGLCWKSGIAAEVIAFTNRSIGFSIYAAKDNFATDELFAWTAVVVLLSLLLEQLLRRLLRGNRPTGGDRHA